MSNKLNQLKLAYYNIILKLMTQPGYINSRVSLLSKDTYSNTLVSHFENILSFAKPRLRLLIMKNIYLLITISLLMTSTQSEASVASENLLINKLIQNSANLSLTQKIETLSAVFTNLPYQFEPLGEGASGQFNQEPLYRFDKFDCQTYVSTILALARAKNVQSFQRNIDLIDYKNGKISFITRNHFADANWVPENIRNGFIRDINDQVAGKNVVLAKTYIDRKTWFQNLPTTRIHIANLSEQQENSKLIQLHHLSQFTKNQQAVIKYIPMSALFIGPQQLPSNIFNRIPSSAIILLVRPVTSGININGDNTAVSHMGYAIRYNNQLFLRAASSYFGKVIDIPLIFYLQHIDTMKAQDGISVYMPIELKQK